jgi:isopentenyl-diphosphate delta-isomerase
MGIAVSLTDVGTFRYQAADPASSLAEHELDHVLVGFDDGEPEPDPAEVSSWRWVAVDTLRSELAGQPDRYTPWLPEALTLAARPA